MAAFTYWFVVFFASACALFPGIAIARLVFPRWKPMEQAALGPLLGLPIPLIAFLLLRNEPTVWTTVLIVIGLSSAIAVLGSKRFRHGGAAIILAAIAAHVVVTGMVQIFWPAPTYTGGDFFRNTFLEPYAFLENGMLGGDRTVFLQLWATGFTYGLQGSLTSQWIFQIAYLACNSIIVGPALLLADRIGGRRAMGVAFLLCQINPFVLHQTMYAWPKLAAGAGVLVVVYLLFLRKDVPSAAAAGVAATIGYLCHQVVAMLILPIGVVWFFRRQVPRRWWRCAAVVGAGLACFVLYNLWAGQYQYSPASRHFMCAIATEWWENVYDQDPAVLWAEFKQTPFLEIIGPRLKVWVVTFTPFFVWDAFYEFQCVPAATGISLFVMGLFLPLARHRQTQAPVRAISVGFLLSTILMALFVGCFAGQTGLAHAGFQALVVLLLVFAAVVVSASPDWKAWITLFVVESLFSIYWWLHRIHDILVHSTQEGDPYIDDFLERDLLPFADYEPRDMLFADVFVGQERAHAAVLGIGALLLAATILWAWRAFRASPRSEERSTPPD